jgi:TonB family protein
MKFPIAVLVLLVSSFVTTAQTSDPVPLTALTYALPQYAIVAEIGGTVLLEVKVDEVGNPSRVLIVAGPMWPCGTKPTAALDELSSTLIATVMKLRFKPAMKDGKPVAKDVGFKLGLKNPKHALNPWSDAPTAKVKPRQINAGVINGKATYLAKPAYSPIARADGLRGIVTVEVHIDEEGKVIRAGAVSGARLLQSASREAACESKFSPTQVDGNPVKLNGILTYNFVP